METVIGKVLGVYLSYFAVNWGDGEFPHYRFIDLEFLPNVRVGDSVEMNFKFVPARGLVLLSVRSLETEIWDGVEGF